ncbi:GNAT family N-acetyltransferase [Glaciimonas immobilis]|uniref:Phosphinothricin acetyltransferase n=1 Tax=Glaciimonas immobilis TaxID=728004 RepID=A0A840S0S1_9BURK|nr:GNAT family N-acetyltransferase [Glaciimonas immobilis]KAF3995939.1 N-acetyltransferase [Glaciimonas immobilis]MBB5202676.1 phosphinothricin acetyltransferase [Glaciimonas immobilis]
MQWTYRLARSGDLPQIVEIYNQAVNTLESTCDTEHVTETLREAWFENHLASTRRPLWVAESAVLGFSGLAGYLSFSHFMNERPGYFITSDMALYLHRDAQCKGLGTFLLSNAIKAAPDLGIETLVTTIFSSNTASVQLFKKQGFEQWGYMPRVARLCGKQRDLIMVGRRVVSD